MPNEEILGDLLVRWTARFAVVCYAARLVCDLCGDHSSRSEQIARWWWTTGCGGFLLHVIVAFHFTHGWNHAAAFEYTAKRTAEMTGWNTGTGLYLNEAFLCLWLTDTVIWWRNLNWPRNRRAYWTIQGVFAFLMIQATAVFGPSFWKPVVGCFAVILLVRLSTARSGKP